MLPTTVFLVAIVRAAFASYCGQAAVPYSLQETLCPNLQALSNGQPVLGCARPSCFGWTADGRRAADTAQFYRIDAHEDGFLRPNDGKHRPRATADGFVPQVSVCESGFKSVECKGDSWVGGIGPQAAPRTSSLKLVCCQYEKLHDSVEVGVAVVAQGQIVTGGEVLRNNRQYAFDYISNIKKAIDEEGNITYTVFIRRFNCLPHFDVKPVKVDDKTQQYIMDKFEKPMTRNVGATRTPVDDVFRRVPLAAIEQHESGFAAAAHGAPTHVLSMTDGDATMESVDVSLHPKPASKEPTVLQGVEQYEYPPALPLPTVPTAASGRASTIYQFARPQSATPSSSFQLMKQSQPPTSQFVGQQQPVYQGNSRVVYGGQQSTFGGQQLQQQQQQGQSQPFDLDLRPLQSLLGIQQQPTSSQQYSPSLVQPQYAQQQQRPSSIIYTSSQEPSYQQSQPAYGYNNAPQQQQQQSLGSGSSIADSLNSAFGQIQQLFSFGQNQQSGQDNSNSFNQGSYAQQQQVPVAYVQGQRQNVAFGQQPGIAFGQSQRPVSSPVVLPLTDGNAQLNNGFPRYVDSQFIRLQPTNIMSPVRRYQSDTPYRPTVTQPQSRMVIAGGQPAIYVDQQQSTQLGIQQQPGQQQMQELPQGGGGGGEGGQNVLEYASNMLSSLFNGR